MKRVFIALVSLAFIMAMTMWPSAASGTDGAQPSAARSSTGAADQAAATACQASFATGSGASQFSVCVSPNGNLNLFSEGGVNQVFDGREGYAVCSGSFSTTVSGYDVGFAASGFLAPTISQPTPGQFPVTITRDTADGLFQLKQVWAKPDKNEDDVTVTMTLTNGTGGTLNSVALSRSGDFDAAGTETDNGGSAVNSAFQWDSAIASGIQEEGVTFGSTTQSIVETENTWYTLPTYTKCFGGIAGNPVSNQPLVSRVTYNNLGNIASGASKTVKFRFGRL